MAQIRNITQRTATTAFLQRGTSKATDAFRDSAKKLQTQKSFITLNEAQQAGVARRLNEDRATLANVSQHIANNTLMKSTNANQTTLHNDISAEILRFVNQVNSMGFSGRTKEDIADEAFDNLDILLNRRQGGKYILNPTSPNEPAIKGKLKNLPSSFVGGVATTNYTDAQDKTSTIEIADESPVRTDPMYAGMPLIRELIATIATFKANGADATYQGRLDETNKQQGVNLTNLNVASQKISAGEAANTDKRANVLTEIGSIEGIDLPVEAVRNSDALRSLLSSFSIATRINSAFEQFAQILN